MTALIVLSSVAVYLALALLVARRALRRWLQGGHPFEFLDPTAEKDRIPVALAALGLGLVWWIYVPYRVLVALVWRPLDAETRRANELRHDYEAWTQHRDEATTADERTLAEDVLKVLREKLSEQPTYPSWERYSRPRERNHGGW